MSDSAWPTIIISPGTGLTNHDAVTVGATQLSLMAAATNRIEVRFCNLGPDPVAIGATGLTWAKRTIVLQVDDVWVENAGANLEWFGICDTGKTASVTTQRVLG